MPSARPRFLRWPESLAAGVHGRCPEQGLGDGYHLYPHSRGLAVSGSRHGSVLTPGRGLVDGCPDGDGAGPERVADGGLAAASDGCGDDPFGSGQPVQQS